MKSQRPDVIELLEIERDWHKEQIQRIDIALAALRGETIETKRKEITVKTIPWASEITKVFKEHNDLELKDVRNKLAENGIPEALEKKYNPTIYQTLVRKVKQGELEKVNGRYCKKLQDHTLFDQTNDINK